MSDDDYDAITADEQDPGVEGDLDDDLPDIVVPNDPSDTQDTGSPADQ